MDTHDHYGGVEVGCDRLQSCAACGFYCRDRSADVEGRGAGTIGGKVVVMREVIGYSMSYQCRAYGRLAGPRNSAAGRLSLLLRHDCGIISSNLSKRLASHRLATSICCGAHCGVLRPSA